MYKDQLNALKKESKKLRAELTKNAAATRKIEKRLDNITVEIKYLRALEAFKSKGKPLPKLAEAAAGKPGRKPGRKGRGGRRKKGEKALTALIPEVLAAAGKAMTTNEIIAALQKKGWKTTAAKPYPVAYNSAFILVRSGVLTKTADGKFTLK